MYKDLPELKIERLPKYLSPSSLSNFTKMPNTSYLERLVNDRKARDPQSLAAGVGTAFDILVKKDLIARGFPCKVEMKDIEKSLENHVGESYEVGEDLMKIYRRSRLLLTTKWREIEGVHDFDLKMQDEDGNSLGDHVPVMGKLDAQVYDEEYDMVVPMDWKCSGWTSKKGATPQQGFMDVYDSKKSAFVGPHKKYHKDIEASEINISWAEQFCTYGWFLLADPETGIYKMREFPVYAHHPVFNGKNKTIKIAVYRAIITVDFQKQLWKKYQTMWKELTNGSYMDRVASKRDLHLIFANAMNERWF